MTKEQYLQLFPYKAVMKNIIVNSSASNLSIDFRTTLENIGKELGFKLSCNCGSGWFTFISKIYNEYLKAEAEYLVNEPQKLTNDNNEIAETKPSRRAKNNKK